ncbi:wiskott-Aldrich syndrome protein family member 1-like [Varroa destructor]|uniref:Uncharacterized protein n=1 Tax=Varroa destructor TaxID=109461 RepID=A0A7M7J674_VARDE|nr:wiskott-Aldrich syndrome protein family member 1-like [Varroa destructor]
MRVSIKEVLFLVALIVTHDRIASASGQPVSHEETSQEEEISAPGEFPLSPLSSSSDDISDLKRQNLVKVRNEHRKIDEHIDRKSSESIHAAAYLPPPTTVVQTVHTRPAVVAAPPVLVAPPTVIVPEPSVVVAPTQLPVGPLHPVPVQPLYRPKPGVVPVAPIHRNHFLPPVPVAAAPVAPLLSPLSSPVGHIGAPVRPTIHVPHRQLHINGPAAPPALVAPPPPPPSPLPPHFSHIIPVAPAPILARPPVPIHRPIPPPPIFIHKVIQPVPVAPLPPTTVIVHRPAPYPLRPPTQRPILFEKVHTLTGCQILEPQKQKEPVIAQEMPMLMMTTTTPKPKPEPMMPVPMPMMSKPHHHFHNVFKYPLMSHDHHIDTHHHAHDMHDVHDMHDNGDHEHYHGHSWESHEDEAGSSKSKWKFGKLFKKNKGGHTHDHNHGHGHRGRKEGKRKFSLFG